MTELKLKQADELHVGDCIAVTARGREYSAYKSDNTLNGLLPTGVIFFCIPAEEKIVGYYQE